MMMICHVLSAVFSKISLLMIAPGATDGVCFKYPQQLDWWKLDAGVNLEYTS